MTVEKINREKQLIEEAKKVLKGKIVWILDSSPAGKSIADFLTRLTPEKVIIFNNYVELGNTFRDESQLPQPVNLPHLIIADIDELYDIEDKKPISPSGFLNIFQFFSSVSQTETSLPQTIFTSADPIDSKTKEQIQKCKSAWLEKPFGLASLYEKITQALSQT